VRIPRDRLGDSFVTAPCSTSAGLGADPIIHHNDALSVDGRSRSEA
jgi:hypothetical protein